jgi:hypothetical protein
MAERMKVEDDWIRLGWDAYENARRGPVDRVEDVIAAVGPSIRAAALREAAAYVLTTFPKKHTSASENSDMYDVQDETVELVARRLMALAETADG